MTRQPPKGKKGESPRSPKTEEITLRDFEPGGSLHIKRMDHRVSRALRVLEFCMMVGDSPQARQSAAKDFLAWTRWNREMKEGKPKGAEPKGGNVAVGVQITVVDSISQEVPTGVTIGDDGRSCTEPSKLPPAPDDGEQTH